MSSEIAKAQEIKRLTTPLKFKDSKAYDSEGNLIKCVETLSDVRFIIEPREGILTDDEILQYAPDSKAASKIRLDRGFGDISDALLVHESLPWYLGIYYVILFSILIPISYHRNFSGLIVLLILFIVPLIYAYAVLNLKRSAPRRIAEKTKKRIQKADEVKIEDSRFEPESFDTLKMYENEIKNLKVAFEVKEKVVRNLIEKRFEPPQLTYDKFIATVDSCSKIFNNQADSSLEIIELAVDDTPGIRRELDNKINIMKRIINQIEDLTNELVINISSDSHSKDEVDVLLEDMENLVDSVKDYKSD
ncbi:MAG: hypothetical protein E7Z83_06295 [Methanobrevibacter sp.]|uniref:hypothetical protein n=1 Tax=Methanobrevibacter sp. TaxID=66852 RepID=UPI001D727DD8|nr:hypothetical protein [Methanobrevibacter sp.]MBE6490452.1 hypothetical protein [Methanobrevibacter sp.]MEE0934091.1 hypothetical protein [Methanobrevibacter sp.]